jgi:hypothetical protein
MKRRTVFRWRTTFALVILLLLTATGITYAACPVDTRANWTTYWAFCNVPSGWQSKIRTAISTWDASDKYLYSEQSPACVYAFSWTKASFSSKGWGTAPGTTSLGWSGGKLVSAVSYYNTDKNWYDSGGDGYWWSPGWYDRRTVALHETGHWMVLFHPSQCGQSHPEAVMEPTTQTKWYLRTDDLNGLQQLGIKK